MIGQNHGLTSTLVRLFLVILCLQLINLEESLEPTVLFRFHISRYAKAPTVPHSCPEPNYPVPRGINRRLVEGSRELRACRLEV